jgi:hypothetical protein
MQNIIEFLCSIKMYLTCQTTTKKKKKKKKKKKEKLTAFDNLILKRMKIKFSTKE